MRDKSHLIIYKNEETIDKHQNLFIKNISNKLRIE